MDEQASVIIPEWLKRLVGRNKAALRDGKSRATERSLNDQRLHTVCVSALCPNRGECFCNGEATFLILGDSCTRACRFCAVDKTQPLPPDPLEPARIAETVSGWRLNFAVLTSPTRDDLPDGGANHYAQTIQEIYKASPGTGTETLVPDFGGKTDSLKTVLAARPSVLAHNLETVPSLYGSVRLGADYARSLKLLETSKKTVPGITTKSGLMLGLGETEKELGAVFSDLAGAGCDFLTLGQYLAPSKSHYPVKRYLEPEEYIHLKNIALAAGLKAVMSGPLVRSSYHAGEMFRNHKKTPA